MYTLFRVLSGGPQTQAPDVWLLVLADIGPESCCYWFAEVVLKMLMLTTAGPLRTGAAWVTYIQAPNTQETKRNMLALLLKR